MTLSTLTACALGWCLSLVTAPSTGEPVVRAYDGPRTVGEPPVPLRAKKEVPSPEADRGAAPVVVDEPDDYDPLRHGPEALAARHWTLGGVVLLTTGALLGAGSLALGLSDPCASAAGNSCQTAARTRATWTMAVPAMVLLGAGTTFLSIGLVKRSRLRASVAAGPSGGGTIGVRF